MEQDILANLGFVGPDVDSHRAFRWAVARLAALA